MITIPEVVEQIIRESPYLEEALTKGIINYSGLARLIKPQIEDILFKNIKEGAVVMALKRLSKQRHGKLKVEKIFRQSPDMIVRSNLTEFTLEKSDTLSKKFEKLMAQISNQHRYFFSVIEGVFETAIIASDEIKSKIEKILSGENIVHKMPGLSSITIKLPNDNVITPGVYYFIFKSLAWENVNIIEVVSTYSEITIILDDKQVDKAFSILKKSLVI